jgi:putative hydrolase of HD superfamily
MKNILNFLIQVNKLKEIPRTGWVWLGVKNPETIAEHTFQVAILSWFLAKVRGGLHIGKVIKIAIAHDLCEVYAGDMTPYYGLLPKDPQRRREFLKKWIKLPLKEKGKRSRKKFNIEKRALIKLTRYLDSELKNEIRASFFDYEKNLSPEGKFVKQIDKIESLIQAIQYFGTRKDTAVVGWWEEIEETVEDPLLIDFLRIIEKNFYKRKPRFKEKEKQLRDILRCAIEIGRLKRMPRRGWVLRKVKNPETIADHTFMTTLMAWTFKMGDIKLNTEKLLKMALCHELCEVYVGDETPYEIFLNKKRPNKKIFDKWLRLSQKEKEKLFLKDYRKEEKAIKKLITNLPPELKKEIFSLWNDFKKKLTFEARFLNQIYITETLLQALLYWRKNKKFPIFAWWEWAYENLDNEIHLELTEELKKEFYPKVNSSLPQSR